jgi:transcription elongation factor/antiterminator RfaH
MFDCAAAADRTALSERHRETRRWYVVHSLPHKEATAEVHLERQGYEVFLPRIRNTVRFMRRTREVIGPLFPRYLFITLDIESQGWRSVRSTIGVASLIMDRDRPRPVPRGLVEELMRRSAADDCLISESRLAAGDSVRFMHGPLADRIGQLLELKDSERAVVLLNLLGAERAVTVESSQLLPNRMAS